MNVDDEAIKALKAIRRWLEEYTLDMLGMEVQDTAFEVPWLLAQNAIEAAESKGESR